MKYKTSQSGYSLVEVLVAISVLLLAMVGPMSIASRGMKSSLFTLEQNKAFFLAQEGIEAMFSLKNNYALKEVDSNPYNPNKSWDWINLLLNGPGKVCNLNKIIAPSGSCSFGIDFRNNLIITPNTCDLGSEANCLLYVDESGIQAVYIHGPNNPALTESPFTRIITIKYISDYAVEITSTVTWVSSVFKGIPQKVTLVTHIFDNI